MSAAREGFAAGVTITAPTSYMWRIEQAQPLARHFYQCIACSEYLVLEAQVTRYGYPPLPVQACPFCGGGFDEFPPRFCGRVNGGRLVKDHAESPCDGSCTMARGWVCDCSCNGQNHGSKLVVWRVSAAGAAPVALPIPENKVTAAVERRKGWAEASESALVRIRSRYGDVIARKHRGSWLSEADFQAYRDGQRAHSEFNAAHAMKTHAGRMKKIAKVAA